MGWCLGPQVCQGDDDLTPDAGRSECGHRSCAPRQKLWRKRVVSDHGSVCQLWGLRTAVLRQPLASDSHHCLAGKRAKSGSAPACICCGLSTLSVQLRGTRSHEKFSNVWYVDNLERFACEVFPRSNPQPRRQCRRCAPPMPVSRGRARPRPRQSLPLHPPWILILGRASRPVRKTLTPDGNTSEFPVSAYAGSSKNLKDTKDAMHAPGRVGTGVPRP